MAQQFQPSQDGLNQILELFRNENADHRVYLKLEQMQGHPDFNNYLAFVLSSCKQESETVRAKAGLQLKNNIKQRYDSMNPATHMYVKQQVLNTIGDESKSIRNIVGTIITTLADKELVRTQPPRTEGWEQLLGSMVQMLQGGNQALVDGSFNALSKICEDMPQALDNDALGRPLNLMIPQFISMFVNPNKQIRQYSLQSVNNFLFLMPGALQANMDKYMANLFQLTADTDKEIRKHVCRAFVSLLDVEYNYLAPHIENVIKFMLLVTQDDDETVALEACEFWSTYCDIKHTDTELLKRYLKILVPVILKGMVYTQSDLQELEMEEEENQNAPDRAEDIKPRFHNAKNAGYNDDSDDEWGDDDDSEVSAWNLRKCSASSLDTLANTYGDELLTVLLPDLNAKLTDPDWTVRESSILALGAVAVGCTSIRQFLKDLVPYLLTLLKDPKPLVRSITCWTLSRYANWVMSDPDDEKFFKPLMIGLLERVLDSNKKVQEAACSAFANLEEEAHDRLLPYLEPIIQNLMYAFHQYQTKNLLILYDAIGTLADTVGPGLNKPEYVNVIMPPFMMRWSELKENDRNVFSLLECLTSIAQAVGPGFSSFAEPVFVRCLKIVENTLTAQTRARQAQQMGQEGEFPDKEFMVCALDLLSGLAEGLQQSIEHLVGRSNILPLLYECLQDEDADVRQSAFALLGDLAKCCIGHLVPFLDKFLPVAAVALDPQFVSVCNNSSWAIGEIAVRIGADMGPFVPTTIHNLILVMTRKNQFPSLLENCAITIGRVGLVSPEGVAQHLDKFALRWFENLARIRDPAERSHAYRGMCAVVSKNPQAVLPHFPTLCLCIGSLRHEAGEAKASIHQLLGAYKSLLGAQWEQCIGQCPPDLRNFLIQTYNL